MALDPKVPSDLVGLFTGTTGLAWHFSASEQRYYSFRNGELHSRVRGEKLVNPVELFRQRCDDNAVDFKSDAALQFKPSSDVYRVWDDWKNRGN